MMRFEYYKDGAGDWRWRLVADNGKIIANSGEGYRNRLDMIKAIDLVRSSVVAEVKKVAA